MREWRRQPWGERGNVEDGGDDEGGKTSRRCARDTWAYLDLVFFPFSSADVPAVQGRSQAPNSRRSLMPYYAHMHRGYATQTHFPLADQETFLPRSSTIQQTAQTAIYESKKGIKSISSSTSMTCGAHERLFAKCRCESFFSRRK